MAEARDMADVDLAVAHALDDHRNCTTSRLLACCGGLNATPPDHYDWCAVGDEERRLRQLADSEDAR